MKDVDRNKRGSVLGGDECKNPQEYTMEINTRVDRG